MAVFLKRNDEGCDSLAECDLGVLSVLLRNIFKIIGVSMVFAVLGTIYVRISPPLYEAQAVVVDDPRGEISENASSVRSLPLFGGSEKITDFDIFKYYLTSNAVASDLLKSDNVMNRLFVEEWDAVSGTWRPRDGLMQRFKAVLSSITHRPDYRPPSVERVQSLLKERVAVQESKNPSMTTLTFANVDPAFANDFLSLVVKLARVHTVDLVKRDLQGQISSLSQRLASEQSLSIKEALVSVLVGKFRTLSLVEGSPSYPLLMIQDVRVSTEPTSPKPFLIIILFTLIGFAVTCFAVVWRHAARSR